MDEHCFDFAVTGIEPIMPSPGLEQEGIADIDSIGDILLKNLPLAADNVDQVMLRQYTIRMALVEAMIVIAANHGSARVRL